MDTDVYDHVVVGAGSAGCVLAARLSEDSGTRVLLVEAGGPYSLEIAEKIKSPLAWPELLGSPACWGDTTVTQRATGTSTFIARGRGLGGSSAINAMMFARGHRSGYDAWEAAGAAGWAYADLLPYFRRSETAPHRDPSVRGTDGPLTPRLADPLSPLILAGLEAAVQCGHPTARDVSSGLEEGFGHPDWNIVDGRRQSATDAYLTSDVRARTNLRIIDGALVHQMVIEQGRCTGVVYAPHDAPGTLVTVRSRGDVILTAGALGSAQLLLLSGVGPREHLRSLGIPVVHDAPEVGANLRDHPVSNLVYRAAKPMPPASDQRGEVWGYCRSPYATDGPDHQILLVDAPGHRSVGLGQAYSLAVILARPASRGTVRLASADPLAPPLIDPRYLQDGDDLQIMIAGVRSARRIGAAPALAPWCHSEVTPGSDVDTDEGLAAFVRDDLGSINHPVGTCRLGTDERSVVDTALRVRGVEGLRVADASVMPGALVGFPHATVYAIAERAAQLLRNARHPAATPEDGSRI
ncbi:GMC family oxidoreductase [Planotetraspora mira]|uniref:Choline dehydrogenase n=1 Tax=Planotetraspora mira TaxID=58121 RepID=A0A8J3TSY4_9ACTN|nr:GMC oxidoreductase [Planotetraspora mira]GII32470.1 choline dehydrogenase [Planotetraspora mira]